MKLSTTEYRQIGKHGLGSSDAAAIMGLTERPSIADVYLRFINGRSHEDNLYMKAGRAMEPVILEQFQEETGEALTIEDVIYIHRDFDYLVTKPDAMTANGYIEAKLTTHGDDWGEYGSDAVPDYVFCQVQHGMEVTEKDYSLIPVVIMGRWGMEFRLYHVAKSGIIVPQMVEMEKKFWNENVLQRVPPEPRSLEDAKKLWPNSSIATIEATPEISDALTALKEIKAELKELGQRKEFCELEVKKFMKDAEAVRIGNKILATWKSNSVSRIDVTRLRHDLPKIAEDFTNEGTERRFLVK